MVIAVGNDQGILGLNPTFAEIVLFNSSNWTRNFEKKTTQFFVDFWCKTSPDQQYSVFNWKNNMLLIIYSYQWRIQDFPERVC